MKRLLKDLESLNLTQKKVILRHLKHLIEVEENDPTERLHFFSEVLQLREKQYLAWKAKSLGRTVGSLSQRERDFQAFAAARCRLAQSNIQPILRGKQQNCSYLTFLNLVAALELEEELDLIFGEKAQKKLKTTLNFEDRSNKFTAGYPKKWEKRFSIVQNVYPTKKAVFEKIDQYQLDNNIHQIKSVSSLDSLFSQQKDPTLLTMTIFLRTFQHDVQFTDHLGNKPEMTDFLVFRG